MRKVIYSQLVFDPKETIQSRIVPILKEQGEAIFHQFGVSYEEFETNAGNFSTAIIELENGKVLNIPVEHIKFID